MAKSVAAGGLRRPARIHRRRRPSRDHRGRSQHLDSRHSSCGVHLPRRCRTDDRLRSLRSCGRSSVAPSCGSRTRNRQTLTPSAQVDLPTSEVDEPSTYLTTESRAHRPEARQSIWPRCPLADPLSDAGGCSQVVVRNRRTTPPLAVKNVRPTFCPTLIQAMSSDCVIRFLPDLPSLPPLGIKGSFLTSTPRATGDAAI